MGPVNVVGEIAKVLGGAATASGTTIAMWKAAAICAGPWAGLAVYLPVCSGAIRVTRTVFYGAVENFLLGWDFNAKIKHAGSYENLQSSVGDPQKMSTSELLLLCATSGQREHIRDIYGTCPAPRLREFCENIFLNEDDPKKVLDDLKWSQTEVFSELEMKGSVSRCELALADAIVALAARRAARAEAENRSFLGRMASALSFR